MQSFWRRQSSSFVRGCMLAATMAVSACGGDDDKGGDGSSVPNGSRLGWTQVASSQQQLQAMTYPVYVDGARMSLSNITCGSQTAAGFACSGRLPNLAPGRRVLELAAVLNGVESERSAPLTINIVASSTQSAATAQSATSASPQSPDQNPSSAPSTVVCVERSRECHNARSVASDIRNPSALSSLVDGRVLFIEDGTAVRVVEGDHLWPEPALLPPRQDALIVGLAVDKTADGKGGVFVAWTEPTSDGQRLSITRYRELQNVLGEGATVVTGLPFADRAVAPLAVDASGLVYLALPTGEILRFTRSGAIPQTNPRPSLVIAEGFSKPVGMAIDAAQNRVWLAGDQSDWPLPLASFTPATGDSASWPQRPGAAVGFPRTIVPTSLSLLPGTTADTRSLLVVGSEGQLSHGRVTADGRVEGVGPVRFEPPVFVHSSVDGPLDSWYVVAGANIASASILRLTRR